jgi:hypothetical protein
MVCRSRRRRAEFGAGKSENCCSSARFFATSTVNQVDWRLPPLPSPSTPLQTQLASTSTEKAPLHSLSLSYSKSLSAPRSDRPLNIRHLIRAESHLLTRPSLAKACFVTLRPRRSRAPTSASTDRKALLKLTRASFAACLPESRSFKLDSLLQPCSAPSPPRLPPHPSSRGPPPLPSSAAKDQLPLLTTICWSPSRRGYPRSCLPCTCTSLLLRNATLNRPAG